MICYRITSPYGGWYETDKDGCIVRCDNGLDERGSSLRNRKSWQCLGATSTHPFARLSIIPLDVIAMKELRHKNGSPRYTLVDEDHGTIRVHGNTKVHGIASITIIQ